MSAEPVFTEPAAEKVWTQYFRRMDRLVRPLDEAQKRDLTLEIKGHLLESFASGTAGSEAERLLDAIERLGEPESFIGPMIADRLLTKASRSFRPKDVLKGLYYHLVGGTRRIFLGTVYVLGYILAVCFGLIAALKFVFPQHIGLFLFGNGDVAFGFKGDLSGLRTEVLGFWIIPICAGLAIALYLGLTRLLKLLRVEKPTAG